MLYRERLDVGLRSIGKESESSQLVSALIRVKLGLALIKAPRRSSIRKDCLCCRTVWMLGFVEHKPS